MAEFTSVMIIRLFRISKCLFELVLVVFLGICQFHQLFKFIGIELFRMFSYYLFNVCSICRDAPFSPNYIHLLCSLPVLLQAFPLDQSFRKPTLGYLLALCCVFVFSFIYFCFYFYSFLYFLWVYLAVLFFFNFLK